MIVKYCVYCKQADPGCGCGAEQYVALPAPFYERDLPFFYMGYIVYFVRSLASMWCEWHFYQGRHYVGSVRKSHIEMMPLYKESNAGIDVFPEIFAEFEENAARLADLFSKIDIELARKYWEH